MASESRHEQIVQALVTAFGTIVQGANYWYTPSAVKAVPFWEDQDLDASLDVIYLIRPGEEDHQEESTGDAVSGGGIRATAELVVTVVKRYEAATENPHDPGHDVPTRYTVANRLVRDALRCLWTQIQIGGLAVNVVKDTLTVNRALKAEAWVLAELSFAVDYDYLSLTP